MGFGSIFGKIASKAGVKGAVKGAGKAASKVASKLSFKGLTKISIAGGAGAGIYSIMTSGWRSTTTTISEMIKETTGWDISPGTVSMIIIAVIGCIIAAGVLLYISPHARGAPKLHMPRKPGTGTRRR